MRLRGEAGMRKEGKMVVRVRDLEDQIGMPYPRPILLCRKCGAIYSANAGDYWDFPKERELVCSCGEGVVLAIEEEVRYKILGSGGGGECTLRRGRVEMKGYRSLGWR